MRESCLETGFFQLSSPVCQVHTCWGNEGMGKRGGKDEDMRENSRQGKPAMILNSWVLQERQTPVRTHVTTQDDCGTAVLRFAGQSLQ